jgi:hypothetical protein
MSNEPEKPERTPGAQQSFDEYLTDLYLFDMTDDELWTLAKSLNIPLEKLLPRAEKARENHKNRQCGSWEVP